MSSFLRRNKLLIFVVALAAALLPFVLDNSSTGLFRPMHWYAIAVAVVAYIAVYLQKRGGGT